MQNYPEERRTEIVAGIDDAQFIRFLQGVDRHALALSMKDMSRLQNKSVDPSQAPDVAIALLLRDLRMPAWKRSYTEAWAWFLRAWRLWVLQRGNFSPGDPEAAGSGSVESDRTVLTRLHSFYGAGALALSDLAQAYMLRPCLPVRTIERTLKATRGSSSPATTHSTVAADGHQIVSTLAALQTRNGKKKSDPPAKGDGAPEATILAVRSRGTKPETQGAVAEGRGARRAKAAQPGVRAGQEQVTVLGNTSDQLEMQVATLTSEIETLRQRLAKIEGSRGVPSEAPKSDGRFDLQGAGRQLRMEHVDPNGQCQQLSEKDDPVAVLSANLRHLGLVLPAARALAREILAGLYAGQMVSLRGSTAGLVATTCARTLAAQDQNVLSVPAGLLDSAELRLCLQDGVAAMDRLAPETTSVLILEGLNRSAIELYGDELRTMVCGRLLGDADVSTQPLLLATIADGPSALPLSPSCCELGPVLHVDVCTWTLGTGFAKVVEGSLTAGAWRALSAPAPATQELKDELEDIRQSAAPDGSVVWRWSLEAARRRMLALCSSQGDRATALCSLAFGWILPYALARGTSSEAIMSALAKGDVEGDDRCTTLLSWKEQV